MFYLQENLFAGYASTRARFNFSSRFFFFLSCLFFGYTFELQSKKRLNRNSPLLLCAQTTANRSEKTATKIVWFFTCLFFGRYRNCSRLQQTNTNSLPLQHVFWNETILTNHDWVCDGSVALKRFLTFVYIQKHQNCGGRVDMYMSNSTPGAFSLFSPRWFEGKSDLDASLLFYWTDWKKKQTNHYQGERKRKMKRKLFNSKISFVLRKINTPRPGSAKCLSELTMFFIFI